MAGDKHPLKAYRASYTSAAIKNIYDELKDDNTAIEAAQAFAARRATEIFTTQECLELALNGHEESIRKRWGKKTEKQRRAILSSACPDLPTDHLSHLYAGIMDVATDLKKAAFTWPSLNMEDLVKGDNILLLLNSRGRNPAYEFVWEDLKTLYLFRTRMPSMLPKAVADNSFMLLHGQTTSETYGKVYIVDKKMRDPSTPEGKMLAETQAAGRCIGVAVGSLVLHHQEFINCFLMAFCLQLMHEMDVEVLYGFGHGLEPAEIKPKLATGEWPSMAAKLATAPYRKPELADLDFTERLIEAKRNEYEDIMWMLREDPAFFEATTKQWMTSRSLLKTEDAAMERRCWSFGLFACIREIKTLLLLWDSGLTQFRRVRQLIEKHKDELEKEVQCFPEEYETELIVLIQLTHLIEAIHNIDNESVAVAMPSFQQATTYHKKEPLPYLPKDEHDPDRILFIVCMLLCPEARSAYRSNTLIHELDRLVAKDPSTAYVTPAFREGLGEVSATTEILRQLILHQPCFDYDPTKEGGRAISYAEAKSRIDALTGHKDTGAPKMQELSPFGQMGMGSNGRFTYPVDRPRTPENVQAMVDAEGHLDAFWEFADEWFAAKDAEAAKKDAEKKKEEEEEEEDADMTTTKAEGKKPATETTTTTSSGTVHKPRARPNLEIQRTTPTGATVLIPAFGNLTVSSSRPAGRPRPRRRIKRFPPPSSSASGGVWLVPQRAHRVARALFHVPAPHEPAAEVAWKDFVFLMASMGFEVLALGGGSWFFWAEAEGKCKGIVFREPEGVKVPGVVVRRMGRRLEGRFGWRREGFAVGK